MPRTKYGAARLDIPANYEEYFYPVQGNVATDGVVYDAVATVSVTLKEVYNKLIDPSVSLRLQELDVSFTQRFTGLLAAYADTISYYWRIRSEAAIPFGGTLSQFTGAYVAIGSCSKVVGTLLSSEDTLSSRLPLGSIPYAPVRISLMAIGDLLSCVTAEVKSSSYVGIKGIVIPGT